MRHLSPDIGVYAQRIVVFFQDGSWERLGANEYQPGALFFFLLPGFLTRYGLGLTQSFILVNAVLIALHIAVLRFAGGRYAAWAALPLFLAAGPISMFRFELVVSLVTLLAFVLWRARRSLASGVLLGLATGIKIYPLLLLPVLFRHPSKAFSWRWAATVAAGFVGGVGFLLLAFWLTGGSAEHVEQSVLYHFRKPVSVQSVLAAGATFAAYAVRADGPKHVNAYGIHGLDLSPVARRVVLLGFLASLVALWVVPWNRKRPPGSDGVLRLSAILFSLLVWSTALQPQYFLWPLACIALLVIVPAPRFWFAVVLGLYVVVLVTEQILYPLNYDAFLDIFSWRGGSRTLFWTFVSGKVVLLALTVLLLRAALPWTPRLRSGEGRGGKQGR